MTIYSDHVHHYSSAADSVLHPQHLTHPRDVASAPPSGGVYGWWFRSGTLHVPDRNYARCGDFDLLYTGISPRKPTGNSIASRETLRKRLRAHVSSDSSRSTLRRTLGTLLSEPLDLVLGMYSNRPHYGDGEERITRWLHQNARAAWLVSAQPWDIEDELLEHAPLALNIKGRHDAFSASIAERRREALLRAR